MRKIPGVKMVKVSLNEGLTVLDLSAENTVTLSQLRKVLKNSGFVSKEATVDVTGTVEAHSDSLLFRVSGSGERFVVVPGGDRSAFELLKAGTGLKTLRLRFPASGGESAPTAVLENAHVRLP